MVNVMHGTAHDGLAYAYSCFGLRIRSAIALPEIPESQALSDEFVIDIRFGPLPDALPLAHETNRSLQVGDGEVLLTVRDTARYLVREGREIVIDPMASSSERNVRLFLLGSAFGILCHQRGLLPLHANAIVVDGVAVAFGGNSGAGKSTLAAWFQRAGYELLCDDVCVVSFDEKGCPLAWPGLPRLKLWGDAAVSFGFDSRALEPAIDGLDKYHVPFARVAARGPFPLRRFYVLESGSMDTANDIARLYGAAAFEAIMAQTYRNEYLAPMNLRKRHFELADALLKNAKVYRAPRDWGYEVFAREAERLERHLRQG